MSIKEFIDNNINDLITIMLENSMIYLPLTYDDVEEFIMNNETFYNMAIIEGVEV